jgi:mRNA interferase MazF
VEGFPTQGQVIFVSFPYSDLTATKVRPAVVLAQVKKDDVLICQVSSRSYADPHAIEIGLDAFSDGSLPKTSYVQTGKLFTCHVSLIHQQVGTLRVQVLDTIKRSVIELIRQGTLA